MVYLFLLLFLCGVAYAQNWEWQNPLPQGNSLKDIYAVNENTAFSAGGNGTIIKTADGGNNWLIISSGVTSKLNTVFFLNENTGYAAGDGGVILKTSNGGSTFIQLNANTSSDLHSLFFLNEQNGYAAGSNGKILFTSDGGMNWIEKQNNDTRAVAGIYFISELKGWAAGSEGMIKFTADGGESWADQNSNTSVIISSVYFINEMTGWACGTEGTILKTTDGGGFWSNQNSEVSNWLKSIRFYDENNGIVTGTPGVILKTTDGGNIWEKINSSSSIDFNSVSITGNNTAWIVGDNGVLVKTMDSGVNWEFQSGGWQPEINSILFFNENEGIIVGNDGLILTTSNGGIEWVKRESGTSKNINAVDYYKGKPDEIWAAGDSATVLFSSNRGDTWVTESLVHITDRNFYSLEIGSSHAAIGGAQGTFLYNLLRFNTGWIQRNAPVTISIIDIHAFSPTTYNALSSNSILFFGKAALTGWIWGINFLPDNEINDFCIIGFNRGWAVGKYGIVYNSTTTFASRWNYLNRIEVNALNSVHFVNNTLGFTAGTNGSAFKSTDGGVSWEKINTGITNFLKKVWFVNENTGWIVGTNGALLKTSNSGGVSTDINNEFIEVPGSCFLAQNYPNPFNPVTTIKFGIPELAFVSLKVYDILGNEISSLVNEVKSAGEYTFQFDANNLSSGTYFYRLTADGFSQTKKLLLIK